MKKMKIVQISILLIFIHSVGLAQSIKWEENLLDGSNRPFYFGGFILISTEFADIDGDGDYDCFVGTHEGNIAFFENIGNSSSPVWKLITLNYDGINLLTIDRVKANFVDIDNDGDLDMFVGGNNSTGDTPPIFFYKNIGTKFSPEWEIEEGFGADMEAGQYTKFGFPSFVDIDNDKDYDLVYGNYKGYCIYYENIGDPYSYSFIKNSPDFFNLPKYWNSLNIDFADIDGDSDLDALIGSHYRLLFMKNIGNQDSAIWEKDTANYLGISKYNCGTYFSPECADLDNNGKSELYVGTHEGQLWTYDSTKNSWIKYNEMFFDEANNLNPEFADLDGDSNVELYIPVYDEFNDTSYVLIFRNIGRKDSIVWGPKPDTLFIDFPYPLNRVTFADVDDDNDMDLIAGFKDFSLDILLYKNTGTRNIPVFTGSYEVIAQFREDQLVDFYPLLVDYDNDSDLDLIISAQNGTTNSYRWVDFFENTGDATSYKWEFSSSKILGLGSIACIDDDKDNDLDLLFAFMNVITVVHNTGTINEPEFNYLHTLKIKTSIFPGFRGTALIDLNNDNYKDLVVGTYSGGLLRFDNKGFIGNIETLSYDSVSIFPNPATNNVSINGLDLSISKYDFSIYSLSGKLVGKYEIGNKTTSLSLLESGLYIYEIRKGKKLIKTGKLVIEK